MKWLFTILLLFAWSPIAHADSIAPFSIVDQYPNGNQHNGAGTLVAKTNVLSSTNALVALVSTNSSLALTASDDNGGAWSKCPASTVFNSGGNPTGIATFYSLNHPTGWTTVTISIGGTDNLSIDLIQISGVLGLDVCGAGNNNGNAVGTAVSTGNVVTAYNNDLIICAASLGADNAGTTSTAGYTAFSGAQSEGVSTLLGAYKTVTATGTYNCAWTASSSNAWAGVALSFKIQSPVAAATGSSVITSAVQPSPVSAGCLHYPRGFGCGTNPPLNSNFRTYLATGGDNTSALNTEFTNGRDELIGPAGTVITLSSGTDISLPANLNVRCMPGVVFDMSSITSSTFHGFSLVHQAGGDGGSIANCTFRGHNWNINPPGVLNSGNNGPWLLMDNGGNVVGYTITNNYFNGPGGQCAVEETNGPDQNWVVTYNTFDQAELYGLCSVGSTGGYYAHNYSTAGSFGNENNNNGNAYANEKWVDNEIHFGVGNGCSNAGTCAAGTGCLNTMFVGACKSDSGTMDGSTGLFINNIINGDGNCFDITYSSACDPGPTVYGNQVLNGAQVHGGAIQPSCFNGIGC